MAKKGKQAAVSLLLTMLLYLAIPMLYAFLAVKGWAETEKVLGTMLLAAALSGAAGGMYLVRKGKWGAFPAALLTGVGTQGLALLTGYLAFGAATVMEERRWLLALAGFLGALAGGMLLGERKKKRGGKRKHR